MNIWWKKIVSVFITVLVLGSVVFPTSSIFAQEQIMSQTGSGFQESQPSLPACGLIGDGTLEGCFVVFFYYVFLYPSAWIAAIAGQIFDFFIAYTLNSDSYHSGGFVEQGWRVVRDIANASFIFILLFAAITFIVKQDTPSLRRILTRVILVAIVINFSLFMTRAIVDAGNILARVFYEKIVVENDDLAASTQYTTISAGLLNKVNPQSILTGAMFQKKYTVTSNENIQDNTLGGESAIENFAVGSGFMILIILIAAIINLALAWTFVSVCVFLIGRTLGLWIMMIMSPVAFASLSISFVKIPKFSFSEWLNKTLTLSFMGVVFLFFLYLTVMFIDISFDTIFNVAQSNMSTVQHIMSVVVPVAIIVFLLNTAKSQAKSMAGDFGGIVTTGLKKALAIGLGGVGLTAGAVAGVGGIAGRQIVGRAGSALANRAGTQTRLGRAAKRTGKYLSTSSFDARNVKIPKPITSTLRSGLSYASGGIAGANDFKLTNVGSGTSRGGYIARKEAFVNKKLKDAESLAPDQDTKVKEGYFYSKDKDGNTIRNEIKLDMSINEAKANLERKKYAIQSNPLEKYSEKKEAQENIKKDFENKQKIYRDAKRKLEDGILSSTEYDKIKDDFVSVTKAKETIDKTVKEVEAKWSEEENKVKAAENALGQVKSDYYRNYSKSVGSFDPRSRAQEASGVVAQKAYAQDKKNEQKDEKDKKAT